MSVEAISWANKQKAGSFGAKLVLLALANYADEEGYCYPSQKTMADVTEMSRDSVARYIKSLEAIGLVERAARFDRSGRRTTDMVRLLINGGGTPQSAGVGTPQPGGEVPPVGGGVRTPQPRGDLNLKKEPSKEESPHTPEGAGVGFSKIDGGEESGGTVASEPDTQFGVFWAQYGADPAASEAKALRQWAKLSPAERAQALATLPRFLDHCRAASRRVCDPSTYLAEQRWKRLAEEPSASAAKMAEPVPRPVETDPVRRAVLWALDGVDRAGWPFIEEGSPEWTAWREAFAQAGLGHRFVGGRSAMVQDAAGAWVKSQRPGRHFPLRRPPQPGAGPPGGEGVGAERVQIGIGG